MELMINSAIQGREVCDHLRVELTQISYNPDLKKMLKNIEQMVRELSQKEVKCRQSTTKHSLVEPIAKINNSVIHLSNLILIARLME
jgi:hypothetical protein